MPCHVSVEQVRDIVGADPLNRSSSLAACSGGHRRIRLLPRVLYLYIRPENLSFRGCARRGHLAAADAIQRRRTPSTGGGSMCL